MKGSFKKNCKHKISTDKFIYKFIRPFFALINCKNRPEILKILFDFKLKRAIMSDLGNKNQNLIFQTRKSNLHYKSFSEPRFQNYNFFTSSDFFFRYGVNDFCCSLPLVEKKRFSTVRIFL